MSNKSALRLSTNVVTPVVKPPSALTIPVALISPDTSNLYYGVSVAIPIFPVERIVIRVEAVPAEVPV